MTTKERIELDLLMIKAWNSDFNLNESEQKRVDTLLRKEKSIEDYMKSFKAKYLRKATIH